MVLSVVVIVLEGGTRLERCLEALSLQSAEIIVPWDGAHGSVTPFESRFPQVRFPAVKGRGTYAQLRALGIQQASGELIAVTEDHCTPRQDWVREIIAAHSQPHAAIGGAVEKETPDTALNWSFYFADYIRYLAPVEGPAHHLTDCNVSYKRGALDSIQDVWRSEFHENVVHAALRGRGQSLWLSPRVVVRQKRNFTLRSALWDRYAFGRLFASTRVAGASAANLAVWAAATPVLPLLLAARACGHVLRTGSYGPQFLRALPLFTLICASWALGEMAGYLTRRPESVLAGSPSGIGT
jgi:Glycosyl transferase family 2